MVHLKHRLEMKGRTVVMMGRNHLICNASAAGLMLAADDIANRLVFQSKGMETPLRIAMGFPEESVFYWILSGCLFLIGSVLPDIDSANSLAGKFFHLPVRHRGITHTIWVVVVLILASFAFKPMVWMTLGYVLHLLLDSVSAMGLLWTYPIRKYREYGSGARVAPGHRVKLYHTGEKSETVFAVVFTSICLCGIAGWAYFRLL